MIMDSSDARTPALSSFFEARIKSVIPCSLRPRPLPLEKTKMMNQYQDATGKIVLRHQIKRWKKTNFSQPNFSSHACDLYDGAPVAMMSFVLRFLYVVDVVCLECGSTTHTEHRNRTRTKVEDICGGSRKKINLFSLRSRLQQHDCEHENSSSNSGGGEGRGGTRGGLWRRRCSRLRGCNRHTRGYWSRNRDRA
jgi:hypothetical protein